MITAYITNTQISLMAPFSIGSEREAVYCLKLGPEPINIHEVANTLSPVIKEKKWVGYSALIGIPHHSVISRQIKQEKSKSDWEMYRSIQTNFHQYFDEKHVNDYFIDFELIEPNIDSNQNPDNEQNQIIQIFAVPRELIHSHEALLEKIGLKAKAFNVDTLALESALNAALNDTVAHEAATLKSISDMNHSISKNLKTLMILECNTVWLIERLRHGKFRLATHMLSKASTKAIFLDFFKSFKEDLLEEVESLHCIGESKAISLLREALASKKIASHLITPFHKLSLNPSVEVENFIENHPFSFAVHLGLKKSYGY